MNNGPMKKSLDVFKKKSDKYKTFFKKSLSGHETN